MKKIVLALALITLSIFAGCGDDTPTNNNGKTPIITSISSSVLSEGDVIIINGVNFGGIQRTSFVSFNDIGALEYSTWSDTNIITKVPNGVLSGTIFVTVNDEKSNGFSYEITSTWVKIGNQIWMNKNLNVDHYRTGDSIPEVRDPAEWVKLNTGAWCYYNNDPLTGAIYGKLYNWYAVNDSRGLAPEGWHTPEKKDWIILGDYLVNEDIAGGKLKSIGTIEEGTGLWHHPNNSATNESGFTAIPGGRRNFGDGSFFELGYYGCYWSETVYEWETGWSAYLCNSSPVMNIDYSQRGWGFSVRCIKD
ncbi:MAG: FISUMP domain-containing protein [bacterium]